MEEGEGVAVEVPQRVGELLPHTVALLLRVGEGEDERERVPLPVAVRH